MIKKRSSFEQNKIQNFEIEEFYEIMQIQGLSSTEPILTELHPSVRHVFLKNSTTSLIGQGPNANIRSFSYLLLCHIRKQHYSKLLLDLKKQQIQEVEQHNLEVRARKLSFNEKESLFLRGPQYENYCLHKLKMFSFAKDMDFDKIEKSPFKLNENLYYMQKPLTSLMIKKLFSEFLKELLPEKLQINYRQSLRSVQYYLNKHHCIGQMFNCLMRHILLSKYQVQSARDYNQYINDHTLCTTLCDAFAIDGLVCREKQYQINSWCKFVSIDMRSCKFFIVSISNNQFEQLGLRNDQKMYEVQLKKAVQENNLSNSPQSTLYSPTFNYNFNYQTKHNSKIIQSEHQKDSRENSVMPSDQESQIPEKQERSIKCNSQSQNTFNVHDKFEDQSLIKRQQKNIQILQDQVKKRNQQKYQPQSFQKQQRKFIKYISDSKLYQFKNKDNRNYKFQKCDLTNKFELKNKCLGDQQKGNIVNNNISNNIYLNVLNNDKSFMIPLINISTSLGKNTSQSVSCLNIKLS